MYLPEFRLCAESLSKWGLAGQRSSRAPGACWWQLNLQAYLLQHTVLELLAELEFSML